MESLICYEISHSQQHPFSSTPLSTRSSQTCICPRSHSPLLFSLIEACFYNTCSWTQSDCMLLLFLLPFMKCPSCLFIPIKSYCNRSFTQSTILAPHHSEMEVQGMYTWNINSETERGWIVRCEPNSWIQMRNWTNDTWWIRIHYYLDYSMNNQPTKYSCFHSSLFICDGSGDNEGHSRQSEGMDEKASFMCANAIRVVQVKNYLDPLMISDNSIYLSQMNTLESCRWPVVRCLWCGEW